MKRRFKVFLAGFAGLVAAGVAVWAWMESESQVRMLADGSRLEVRRVEFGKEIVQYPTGSALDKVLFRLAPARWRQPSYR